MPGVRAHISLSRPPILALGRYICLAVEHLHRIKLYRQLRTDHAPHGLVLTPPVMQSGEADKARLIYHGEFSLNGTIIKTGVNSIFHITNLPISTLAELASFSWLRHLHTADNEIARAQARTLIGDWIDINARKPGINWHGPIIAKRITSWLTAAPFFLKNADIRFHERFLRSLNTQIRFLFFSAHHIANRHDRLETLIGTLIAALSVAGNERSLPKIIMRLTHELEDQILPDGGHISRAPDVLLGLLQKLICLRETFGLREHVIPRSILSAIDRMTIMLRFFQLGDQGLAFFHGNGDCNAFETKHILEQDSVSSGLLSHAPHSAFHRLEQGRTMVIFDVGQHTASIADRAGLQSALAFEMSDGPQRLIVNCGLEKSGMQTCSTLAIDKEALQFARPQTFWRQLLSDKARPHEAQCHRTEQSGVVFVEGGHDAALAHLGLRHKRSLYLAENGHDLRGEDNLYFADKNIFTPKPVTRDFTLHFHIHPDVKVTRAQNPNSLLLLLPDRTGWQFTMTGAELDLETSEYAQAGQSPRPTMQIVLRGSVREQSKVKWAFKRLDKIKKQKPHHQPDITPLPFGD